MDEDEDRCEPSSPCSETYECCQHGGTCEVKEHEHYDAVEHMELLHEAYLNRRAEGPSYR